MESFVKVHVKNEHNKRLIFDFEKDITAREVSKPRIIRYLVYLVSELEKQKEIEALNNFMQHPQIQELFKKMTMLERKVEEGKNLEQNL